MMDSLTARRLDHPGSVIMLRYCSNCGVADPGLSGQFGVMEKSLPSLSRSMSAVRESNQIELERSNEGDLLLAFESRFRRLANQMLRQFPSVRRWEETDDIVQAALIRFHASLRSLEFKSPLHMRRTVALHLRRQLLDLARRNKGGNSFAANHESCGGELPHPSTHSETPSLEEWACFHQYAEALPDEVSGTFELIWYAGLSQQDAADQLGISLRQCQRHWAKARMLISRQVSGDVLLS